MSFRLICIWVTKQILASILENLRHALPFQQKCRYSAKQVTQSTGRSNSANKIISADNHLPVSLIFLFSVLALPLLRFFSYYLIHILIPLTLLYSFLSVLFSLYLYGFLSAWPIILIKSELQKLNFKNLDLIFYPATTSIWKETQPQTKMPHADIHTWHHAHKHTGICAGWKFKDLCALFINNMSTKQKEKLRSRA